MTMAPLKLLLTAYGLSGLAGLALAAQGAGGLGPALVFWLGGAVATLGLAAVPGLRAGFRDEARLAPPANPMGEAAASLAQLERDRAADSPAGDAPRRPAVGLPAG